MLNFCLYKPCAMCLSWLPFQPCAGSEPDCNCCLSNKYTYMQLRSPEVNRVNFHLSDCTVCIAGGVAQACLGTAPSGTGVRTYDCGACENLLTVLDMIST